MDSNRKNTVLLVEDDPGDARLVVEQLCNGGKHTFHVVNEGTLSAALEALKSGEFCVVLLDLSLPDSFGTDTIDEIHKHAPELPIIVLTGADDEGLAVEAVQKGAQDYLIKGEVSSGVLTRAILYAEYRKQSELKLTQTIDALKEANQQVLAQQKSVIEEERLKVLLQMAGATAHELNQPIMTLLGTIELMQLDEPHPQGWDSHLERIEQAGRRIADIVKKITTIRDVDYKPYPGGTSIINLDRQIEVLAIEDNDADYERFKGHMAHQERIRMTRARSKTNAIRLLEKKKFNLVFLDYLLADGNGIELLQWMEKEGIDLPVIAVTGHGDEIVASHMIKAGALDYLPKASINQDTLSHGIFNALEKFQLKKEAQRATQKMVQMATRDALTGLYNRHYMNDVLEKEYGRALRYGSELACLLLDLDFFKEINDTYGHRFGDFVLQQFAERLRTNIRETDTCFRYGGEEFLVLLPQTTVSGARDMALKLCQLCQCEKFDDGNNAVTVTTSIGIASLGDPPVGSAAELITRADKALYLAKAEGRNGIKIYEHDETAGEKEKSFKILRERMVGILEKAKIASIESLEQIALDMGGEHFREHNQRVIRCIDLFGSRLNFSPAIIKSLKYAAVLHDFTKVLLGDFYKKASLTDHEKDQIESHPYILSELIEPFDFFMDERTVLLWHHENYDGSGYPDGLQGNEIPLGARIFSLVDAFVAMTSYRTYKKVCSEQEVVDELVTNAGTQFDPMLVNIMLDIIKSENLLVFSGKDGCGGPSDSDSAGSVE